MGTHAGPINPCCLNREVAGRVQRARAAAMWKALDQILRAKSLEAAKRVARRGLDESHAILSAQGWDIPIVADRPTDSTDAD